MRMMRAGMETMELLTERFLVLIEITFHLLPTFFPALNISEFLTAVPSLLVTLTYRPRYGLGPLTITGVLFTRMMRMICAPDSSSLTAALPLIMNSRVLHLATLLQLEKFRSMMESGTSWCLPATEMVEP